MKPLLTIALFVGLIASLSAQSVESRKFTARVLGDDNTPLIGATVYKKDGATLAGGAITDMAGYFTLTVKGSETLRFYYTGYISAEYGVADIEEDMHNQIILASGLTLPEVVITSTRLLRTRIGDRGCGFPHSSWTNISVGLQKSWEYYPNPTTDGVTVRTDAAGGIIRVFSLDGRLVTQTLVNDIYTRVDMSDLPPAMYFLYYDNTGWSAPIGKVSVVR